MRLRPAFVIAAAFLFGSSSAALAVPRPWLVPPVEGAIVRRFEAPPARFGPGHRGIDYAVTRGTQVRAAAAGIVGFAGRAAGVLAVTVRHAGGLSTTYSDLSDVYVRAGESVGEGRWLGAAGASHPDGREGLHFGVKLEGDYVDPEAYLGPVDVTRAIHLAPLLPEGSGSDRSLARSRAPSGNESCVPLRAVRGRLPPPNDNIAVAVPGIGSETRATGAADEELLAAGLGYRRDRLYVFSYDGVDGPRWHRPYRRSATYRDLRPAARRLRALLVRIGRSHPGRDVDLIAHSQGGIVARVFLEHLAASWDPRLPRVAHLVTFVTPHTGAPLAGSASRLQEETFTGRWALEALSRWAQREGPVPDPLAPAVRQLAPRSSLLDALAREDVLYGTRVLALALAQDALIPAHRALYPGKPSRVVDPGGLMGHGRTPRSTTARALAHGFLRGARPACPTFWDVWGPRLGRAIEWAEDKAPWLYGQAEEEVGGRMFKVAARAVTFVGRGLRRAWRLVRSGFARRWP